MRSEFDLEFENSPVLRMIVHLTRDLHCTRFSPRLRVKKGVNVGLGGLGAPKELFHGII
jgi:hypothetical protein